MGRNDGRKPVPVKRALEGVERVAEEGDAKGQIPRVPVGPQIGGRNRGRTRRPVVDWRTRATGAGPACVPFHQHERRI